MIKVKRYITYEYFRLISIIKYIVVITILGVSISLSVTDIINIPHANVWDIIVLQLVDPRNSCLLFLFGYIIFIDNILIDYELEHVMILKLKSRATWWKAKVILLLSKTILYIMGPTIVASAIGLLKYPISNNWSEYMMKISHNGQLLNSAALINSPLLLLMQVLVLLFLSYFTIGLVVFVATLITNSRIIGLVTSVILWIVTIVPVFSLTYSPIGAVSFNHIYINAHRFFGSSQSGPTVCQSVLYWLGLITLLYAIGYYISLKRNFIGVKA